MVHGYPAEASVVPGGELVLHVSTDAPWFRVDFYRYGTEMQPVAASEWLPGRDAPNHLPHQDWGQEAMGLRGERLDPWPAYPFPVGEGWASGVYVAVLVEGDGQRRERKAPGARTPDARHGKALFVVKAPAGRAGPAILYKVPLLTYHAYNRACGDGYDPVAARGGWSLYTLPPADRVPVAVPPSVSLRRPGGGTGGTPTDIHNFDPFDPTPRQAFVHWDAPFIRWLEGNGYRVDYCTDLDVHRQGGLDLLRRYRLVLSVGHDEYWSDAMRAHVERFVQDGGNLAFFAGNACWWRVSFDDELSFRRSAFWSDPSGPDRPENSLTGVSFRNGGERDVDDNPVPVGYRVQHADHWVFAGTGLADGDTFGAGPGEYLVGYECDGADFDRSGLARGRPVAPTTEDGTPADFTILGVGDLVPSGWGTGNRAATMGVHSPGGTVFTAATTDWARLLAGDPHPVVARVTANVVERLAGQPREGTGGSTRLRTR